MASRNNSGLITDVLSQPITPEELKGYKGWVEMESEPMFFQAMLHEMSAPNLKITELFSIDEDSLAALSQPVHGLVFLFQYDESAENSAEERDDCPDGLWFANQTTANACATVALMNITMNITSANFGPELQNFKAETASLSSPHRGYHLDTNDFIRCIHNSIARRTQLLTEDLAYKNKAEDWEAEQLKRERALKNARNKKAPAKGRGKAEASAASTSTSKAKKKKKPVSESTSNHYIAYVPYGGKVWELDGLENKPLCLGPYEDENWLQTAIEIVQVRMAAGDFSNTFNLLAVCASSLQDLTDRLATNLAGAHILELQYQDAPDWSHPSPKETLYPEQKLQNLALSWDLVDNIGCSEAFTNRFRAPDFDQEKASTLMVELMAEQQSIENEMSPEIAVRDTALTEWRARQRDYTPVIHRFLLSLAERGVLGQVVKEFGGP
ncbi:hypothetical protein BJ170DRAFT_704310 [Xylariales sp. AK1849]|nr:hypothetical protein BJ170DRAFT_704310 [Xylariales sp. AK1849]